MSASVTVAAACTCPLTSTRVGLTVRAAIVGGSFGGRFTVTPKLQEAAWPPLSRAVHTTVVEPIANEDPDAGLQLTVVGGVPPVAVGVVNVTVAPTPSGLVTCCATGQVTASAGGPGAVGLSEQLAATATQANSAATLPNCASRPTACLTWCRFPTYPRTPLHGSRE